MSARATDRVVLAIVLSLVALVLFDIMGLVIKLLSGRYGAAELSTYRNLVGLVPSFVALTTSRSWVAAGRPIRIRQWKLGFARGAMVTLAQFLFYFSLGQMAFATASTLTYANALFMTALAVPLLGERVGVLRWSAVLVGFVGVVLVMGPGQKDFGWVSLAPIGAAFFYALSGVCARLVDDDVPSPLLNLYSSGTSLVGAFVLAMIVGGFSPIDDPMDLLWMAAMGVFGGCAVLFLVISYRMTEQSNLAPFSYFGIPLAFGLGWLFFGEAPFDDLFPGALLIAAGGLLVIWREQRSRR